VRIKLGPGEGRLTPSLTGLADQGRLVKLPRRAVVDLPCISTGQVGEGVTGQAVLSVASSSVASSGSLLSVLGWGSSPSRMRSTSLGW